MPAILLLLLTGCDQQGWCERFNLACDLGAEEPYEDLVDEDGDIWEAGADCDDDDPDVHPTAPEICDGIDNNCDGVVDEGTPGVRTWYYDEDLDGYGIAANTIESCEQPPGFALQAGDCEPRDEEVHPGAVERCGNGKDDDCDGDAGQCTLSGDHPIGTADVRLVRNGTRGQGLGNVLAVGPDPERDEDVALVVGAAGSWGGAGGAWVFGRGEGFAQGVGTWFPTTTSRYAEGTYGGQGLGSAVALPGDLDGDGVPDLAIGVPGARLDPTSDLSRPGRVLVLRGPDIARSRPLPRDLVIWGTEDGDGAGDALAAVPDPVEPGVAGLLVGAPATSDDRGAAALFTGITPGEVELADGWLYLRGAAEGDALGAALAGGDLDGDGLGDLVVVAAGAPTDQVLVFLGPLAPGVTTPDQATLALSGDPDASPGSAVSVSPDLDGDGQAELLVGAPAAGTEAGDRAGTAWVIAGGRGMGGRADLEDRAWATFHGGIAGAGLGSALSGGGRLDGGDAPALLLGAPGTDHPTGGLSLVGATWIVRGVPAGTTVLDDDAVDEVGARILGEEAGWRAGSGVLFHPDVDGNDLDEFLLGVTGASDGTLLLFRPRGI